MKRSKWRVGTMVMFAAAAAVVCVLAHPASEAYARARRQATQCLQQPDVVINGKSITCDQTCYESIETIGTHLQCGSIGTMQCVEVGGGNLYSDTTRFYKCQSKKCKETGTPQITMKLADKCQ